LPPDIDSATLLIRRRGVEEIVDVPIRKETKGNAAGRLIAGIMLAAMLLGTALPIVWNARTRSGIPLLLFYGCLSVLLIVTLAEPDVWLLGVARTVALGLLPPVLTHLALTFPKERDVLHYAPSVLGIPYGLAAAITFVSLASLERAPRVWAIADRFMISLAAVAVLFILIGSIVALRQADSRVERARARICLYGMVGVLAFPASLSAWFQGIPPGGSATLLGLGAALFPLPIGYAISRYQLFDDALDIQRLMARLLAPTVLAVLLTLAAMALHGVGAVALQSEEPAAVFAVIYGVLLLCEVIRAPLWSAADAWASRRLESLRRLRDEHACAIGELRTSSDYGRMLAVTVRQALQCRSLFVYVGTSGDWTLAYGHPGISAPDARRIEAAVAGRGESIHLACEEQVQTLELRGSGFEMVAPLRRGDDVLGVVLIGPSETGQPYSSLHRDFVRSVCLSTAVAVHNANLAQDLVAAERFAAVGRLGAEMAHELGKPLGLLERLAMRLPSRLEIPERARRDAKRIFELSKELRGIVRGLLEPVTADGGRCVAGATAMRVDELVDQAVHAARRYRDHGRILVRLEPGLPNVVRPGERLVRALANLLENALLACGPEGAVEVVCRNKGESILIEVVDSGSGMTSEVAAHVFEPFFTTRSRDEGSGLGLSFARDALEEVGGRIEIETKQGKGTSVRMILPGVRAQGPQAEGSS
jgi:nitrogen-specific signal transduction histidine kinase